MNLKNKSIVGVVGALVLAATPGSGALAAPSSAAAPAASPQSSPRRDGGAHASIQLEVGHATAWVGQALPITLRAYFRGVEGVTLEGAPQIASREIVTSVLAPEPRQATAIIGGERTLVATWTGTVTPSAAGPVELTVDLPVRLRYREVAPRIVTRDPWPDDPFGDMDADPFGASMFDRMRRMMEQVQQPLGRVREQVSTLKAAAHLDALALPTADQPASFSGAVGRFTLTASASTTHLGASEPLTLRIAVDGEGELDRVDLPGVATSDTWKAYPPKLSSAAEVSGKKRGPRVFEQVLVPLQGGDLTVPPVSLAAFDPAAGRYVIQQTRPLTISVDAPSAVDPATPPPAPPSATAFATPATREPPSAAAADGAPKALPVAVSPISLEAVGLRVLPVLLLVAAALLFGGIRRAWAERSLRRAMRRAAAQNAADGFFSAARRLIEARLARRWGVSPEAVTVTTIHERLGAPGAPLADVLAGGEALRFGRAGFERADLLSLCSSVEQSLRGAS